MGVFPISPNLPTVLIILESNQTSCTLALHAPGFRGHSFAKFWVAETSAAAICGKIVGHKGQQLSDLEIPVKFSMGFSILHT